MNGGVSPNPCVLQGFFYLFTLFLVIASGSAAIQYFYNHFPLTLTTNHYYSAMCIGILSVLSAQERFPKCVIAIASAKKNDYNMPVFIQDKVNLEQGENR